MELWSGRLVYRNRVPSPGLNLGTVSDKTLAAKLEDDHDQIDYFISLLSVEGSQYASHVLGMKDSVVNKPDILSALLEYIQ